MPRRSLCSTPRELRSKPPLRRLPAPATCPCMSCDATGETSESPRCAHLCSSNPPELRMSGCLPHSLLTPRRRICLGLAAWLVISSAFLWPAEEPDHSGVFDDYNQWKQALGTKGATDAARIAVLPGFEVELIRSAGKDDGSWVSFTFDPKGRVLISREDRGILRLTLPARPGDPQKLELINDTLHECRGLLWAYDSLYANANNDKGLYRLRDTHGDDHLDKVELLRATPGDVGHGRNDLLLGPDGFIYLIHGNDTKLPKDYRPE